MRAREHAVEVNVVLASGHPEDLLFFTVFFLILILIQDGGKCTPLKCTLLIGTDP